MALAFGVLGALEVRRDGELVPLPSGRRRAVLAALLVRGGGPVSADVLIDAAWGEVLPAAPRPALRTVLSRLRAALGPKSLVLGPGGYALAAGADAVDAVRFELLFGQAATAPAPAAAALLDEALELWRGGAYVEFGDLNNVQAEAVRLDELRLAAMERRAELALELGDADTAVIGLERLVADHPLREQTRHLLMTALYRAGRPIEALGRYRDYQTLLADELGLDPSPELRDLEIRILSQRLPGADPLRRRRRAALSAVWLPPDTTFVGRDDDVRTLRDALVVHRLVTVTGVGGVGKTRLVAEALRASDREGDGPIAVIELADVAAGRVAAAVASALGVRTAAETAGEVVLEYLSISTGLLVLDNCEHLLGEVRPFVEAVLGRCPGVRLIATSRHRLGPVEEQVLPLEPLPTPEAGAAPDRAELSAAIRLFADRVRRVSPAFTLTTDTVPAVVDICRRLDGLPLALELAATRAATLGLEPLRSRLDASLRLLGEEGQPRRSSLETVVDWSYRLLSPEDRRLLAALSVFDGGFDLDAAEKVGGQGLGRPVAVGLARLIEASLVSAHAVAGRTRYRMLMIVRAFVAERLTEAGEERDARVAHARWVQSLVETTARDAAGPGCTAALARLRQDQGNVAAAVRWALGAGRVELAGRITGGLALCPHWHPDAELLELMGEVARRPGLRGTRVASLAVGAGALAAAERGQLADAERLATEALGLVMSTAERSVALVALGVANVYAGRHDRSAAWWLQLLEVDGLPEVLRVDAHGCLAMLAGYSGNRAEAHEHAALALRAAETAGAEGSLAFAAYVLGEITLPQEPEAAVIVLREAANQADRAGAAQVASVARIALLSALTRAARPREALALVGPLLQDEHRMGRWPQLWTSVRLLAEVLVACDRHETAALLLAAAEAAPSAPQVAGEDVERYRRLAERISHRIGVDSANRIGLLARTLPRAQLIDRALAAVDDLAGTPP